MDKLKVGVVGCGFIAKKRHIPSFLRLKKNVYLSAVCDLNQELAKGASKQFGIPHVYSDLSDMLSKEHLDIVDVCTPPKVHAPVALEAMESGCNVLLEKPMAPSLKDCDRMIEAARQNKVQKFLFSSSACVYPTYKQTDPDVKGLREEDAYPADPDNFYGWEKLYTEKMCEAYQRDHGMDIRMVRYHNIYGPEGTYKGGREKAPAALCRKVAEASNPGTITIWGDGKQTRSFCYIDDCVRGTLALMDSDYDKPINIGSERLVTINELADMIIKISGKKISKEYDLSKPQGVRGRNADISLARKVLGWEPKVSLEEGLAKTYNWITEKCAADQTLASQ